MAAKELFLTPRFNDTELKAYYRLEGNSNDAKGSHNGTDASITYNAGNGKFNQGAGFASVAGIITFDRSADFEPTTSYSISAWVKFNNFSYSIISDNYDSRDATSRGFGFQTSAGKLQLYHYTTGTITEVKANTTLSTGQFYHVVVTWDGSNARFYVNGTADGSPALTTIPSYQAGVSQFCLGGYRDNGVNNPYFDGCIDDYAFWNGKVLSPTEISDLYNGNYASGGAGFLLNLI